MRGTMLRPSLRRTPETASVKESAGLPWGCVLQPLAPAVDTACADTDKYDAIGAEEVPRCTECFGYISAYCMFERKAWICCLCGCKNELPLRYASASARAGLAEMQRGIVDLLEECIEVDDVHATELRPEERPAFVAVVDVSGSEDFVEVARTGILALLEALPPSALFGLVTFSSTVGVFDLRSAFPHCYHIPIPDQGEMPTGIVDVLPAECMLVQIAANKHNITAAVESLTAANANLPAGTPRKNGLGACLDSLLESFETSADCTVRFITVLGSMPNHGLGTLTPPPQLAAGEGPDRTGIQKPPRGAEEYAHMAERLKKMAAVLDLYVVAEEGFVGVEALCPVVQCAGGTLVYYSGIDTSALPQDLYRIYARPFASNALLRLRCSSGFTVARGFGHLVASDTFDNLYHVASCHSESCFAVDLEFDSPSGVTVNLDVQPTIQLAFSYSCIVPIPDSTSYQVPLTPTPQPLTPNLQPYTLDPKPLFYSCCFVQILDCTY